MALVPHVDLLDPSVDPSDEALSALMSDTHQRAIARRDRVRAEFDARVQEMIRSALDLGDSSSSTVDSGEGPSP